MKSLPESLKAGSFSITCPTGGPWALQIQPGNLLRKTSDHGLTKGHFLQKAPFEAILSKGVLVSYSSWCCKWAEHFLWPEKTLRYLQDAMLEVAGVH